MISSSFARFQGVNIESRSLVPFWKGNFCDVISLKVEQPIILNFACLLLSTVPLLVANLNRSSNCNLVFVGLNQKDNAS